MSTVRKGVTIIEPPSNKKTLKGGVEEEVNYRVQKGENKLMKLKSKRFQRENYAYYESGITNVEEKIVQPVIKKVIPRANNFAYLDSNNGIYKEKGENVETEYTQKRGVYKTICRSPQFDATPIIKYDVGEETTISRPRNSKLVTRTLHTSERGADVVPLTGTRTQKVTMKTYSGTK